MCGNTSPKLPQNVVYFFADFDIIFQGKCSRTGKYHYSIVEMVLKIMPRVSSKAKFVLGSFALCSAAAASHSGVLCQGYDADKEGLNDVKSKLSGAFASSLSAMTYVKERAENTGIVRFGRAATVVRINNFLFNVAQEKTPVFY